MSPISETLEQLRALDRRLMALDGDLQSRLESVGTLAVGPVRTNIHVADSPELSRLQEELNEIWVELRAIADDHDLAIGADLDLKISRWDSEGAYERLGHRVNHQRGRVREAFSSLKEKFGDEVGDVPPLADLGEYEEHVPGALRYPRLLWTGIVLAVAAALFGGLTHYDREKMREFAVAACAAPPVCEGDQMEIELVDGIKYEGVRYNRGLVLYRRAADCKRRLEVFHDSVGRPTFEGSSDDPDPEARGHFLEDRTEFWKRHEVRNRVPCARADEL